MTSASSRMMLVGLVIVGLGLVGSALAQQTALPQDASPAQERIAAAKRQIEANPKKVQAFNDLAIAYQRRARETSDPRFLGDAEQAVTQGLQIDARDFQIQKTQVSLLLSRQDYVHAKEQAMLLNRHTPDDAMVYGYLAEADIGLGNYPEAEKSAQWMLNMLANNIPGLLLGAQLRVLYGDADGALDLLNTAFTETSPVDVEQLAWIANRIATVQIDSGKIAAAAKTLDLAERLFPHYAYTLENLAHVRVAEGRAKDAVMLLQQATQIEGDASTVFKLAEAQAAAGQAVEARSSYAHFESMATNPGKHSDETRRDLILLYARDAAHAAAALKLAQNEMAQRHDVWTLDALAWALNANGMFAEADDSEQKALAVGIENAQLFDHAGHIAANLKRMQDASKYFVRAGQLSPSRTEAEEVASSGEPRDSRPATATAPSPVAPAAPLPIAESATPAFAPIPAVLLVVRPTDTDRMIRNAQTKVAPDTKDATAYARLGAAYFQRARETGDVNDYDLAEQALTKSLELVSSDFSADVALGTMAEVCMGEHRFADALTFAQKALALGSGDVSPFAIVGDAYADMGEYDKASAAYARLTPREMTLSPRAAYARDSRLAYVKFISGDTAGAIALMKTAVGEGLEAQLPSENLAWLYYELGDFDTQAGDAVAADAAYLAALKIHPGDYRALAAMGKLRANQGRFEEAIVLYQKAIAIVPMPLFVSELGDLYSRAGNQAEARKEFQLVEYIGLLGHINQVLHNRDLALFYADHDTKLPEALELARKEFEVRHDVYTWDALAWALYKNGTFDEAAQASEKALQFGTRDSLLLYHAGVIAEKSGKRDQARSELQQALEINPHFHVIYAQKAQQELISLDKQAALNASLNHAN
jgi:tetratricopeptide (TPR) repeat protein